MSRGRELWTAVLNAGALAALLQACSFPEYGFDEAIAGDGGALLQAGASAGAGGAAAGGEAKALNLAGGSAAGAASPDVGPQAGRYRLVATNSSKCMDANGSVSPESHITVSQHGCDMTRPQSFALTSTGTGYYALEIAGSTECIDIEDHATVNKALIVRATCNGNTSQDWMPVAQDDGSYFLVNRFTSKCLDVPGISNDDISLQQFTCNVGGNQRWLFKSLGSPALQ
jgi:hypothetical protein